MGNIISHHKPVETEKKGSKEKVIRFLTLFLVIGIMVALFLYREKVAEFQELGYLGVFLISLVSNATVILPVPGFLAFIPLLNGFNPILLGLAGATGGVIGEITGYMAGYSSRGLVEKRPMYKRVEGWMKRWGIWMIFVFAVAPFLLDVAGVVAGALRFPLWKFLLVAWVGKSLKYIAFLLLGAWGWEALLRYLG